MSTHNMFFFVFGEIRKIYIFFFLLKKEHLIHGCAGWSEPFEW